MDVDASAGNPMMSRGIDVWGGGLIVLVDGQASALIGGKADGVQIERGVSGHPIIPRCGH
jgi:hypothetical protein